LSGNELAFFFYRARACLENKKFSKKAVEDDIGWMRDVFKEEKTDANQLHSQLQDEQDE